MRPRLALSIAAALYILLGLALILVPAPMLSSFGWPAVPDEALVPTRDLGTWLITVGVIDWLARGAVGGPLRGLLRGNIVGLAASVVVNAAEIATGAIPEPVIGGLLVTGLVVNIPLIAMFALALRRA